MPLESYSDDALHEDHRPRTFPGTADQVAFPLGGIGTGNISLGSRGQLTDWEIFNRPGKGNELPFTFFTVRCESEDGDAVTRVLESKQTPPYESWYGFPSRTVAGLPRLERSSFTGEYPVAEIEFSDEKVPANISLSAFTPFVPLDPEASGIPTAILQYTVSNPTDVNIEVSLVGSMSNPVGATQLDSSYPRHHLADPGLGGNRNEYREAETFAGIHYTSEAYDSDAFRYGDASLVVLDAEGAIETEEVTHKAAWIRDEYPWVECQDFWDDLKEDGRLEPNDYDVSTKEGTSDVGSVGVNVTLGPEEERTTTFLIAWHFPNRPYRWDELSPTAGRGGRYVPVDSDDAEAEVAVVQNHYATRFDDAWDVAGHVARNFASLKRDTDYFHEAFFGSSLPGYVLEAVSSNITVVRSPTCFWLADGSFLAYEGCYPTAGVCEGTCTHVWNYAHTLAFLFPSLEREMRRIDYLESTDPSSGKMNFRTSLPFDDVSARRAIDERPAADGQMGTLMRLYREWKYSGDDEFLRDLWPTAKQTLEFAFEFWDVDEDGVMERPQHNTHDIQFYGVNSMVGTWYLGALRAGAELARAVGDDSAADRYEDIFERGRNSLDVRLWDGKYYVQDVDDVNSHKYQYGIGCLSDQVIGQWFADVVGLGDLLPRDHVRTALQSVFEHNFVPDLSEHENCQRTYALNDEAGLVTCTWPRGDRPDYPFRSDEVWTGIEYQVASHLIYNGFVNEGLAIVKANRDRHDGIRRNPWNEFECGYHYARAMASWTVYTALCGFSFDQAGVNSQSRDPDVHEFSIDPAISVDEFSCFWITGNRWGRYKQWKDADSERRESVETLYDGT